ncbi:structural maintenance of chromosomes protein 5 isoform X2 [Orussus abietinus]|nr:structural maintenance of chromosomes protein 5 isoform X2 [Orussus abietinus]
MEENTERGIITRIYLENFVTYTRVVVRPGRHLNVIIGPNGTGKSTIVCAIVLGLGGKPKVIGRALHIGEYVRAGCDKAKIEIELKDYGDKRTVVTRIFSIQNQTTWMVNGKQANLTEVMETIKAFNIQVDNLCQFLPQDRVQDFAKMNAQELLENTERSVGNPNLIGYHMKLKDYRTAYKDLEKEIGIKKELLNARIQRHNELKEVVGIIKEKKRIRNKITSLKQKKAWILYDSKRKELVEAKKNRDAAAQEMRQLDLQLKPMNDAIIALASKLKTIQNTVNEHDSRFSLKMAKINKLKETNITYERDIKEIERTRDYNIEAEENRDREIALVEQQRDAYRDELRAVLSQITESDLRKEQKYHIAKTEERKNILNNLGSQRTSFKQQDTSLQHEMIAQQESLNAVKDVETKRMELLKRVSKDAYTAVLWLRQNRDKFSATIHEPMILTLSVRSVNFAKYLENTIAKRDLIAFVCEDKKDMNLFLSLLRGKERLQVNALHMDPDKSVQMQPKVPIENIRQFGFEYYLSSLIDAHPTIMKYLVSMYNLSNIPIGSDLIDENVDSVSKSFRLFFSRNTAYAVKVSKYSGATSTTISSITGNGTLSITLDTNKMDGIKERLRAIAERKTVITKNLKEIEEKIENANKQLQEQRDLRAQCQNKIQNIEALKSRINVADIKIQTLQRERTTIEEIRKKHKIEIQNVIRKQFKSYAMYSALFAECLDNIADTDQKKLELKVLKQVLRAKEEGSHELREKCAAAERTFKALDEELSPLKEDTKRMYKEALESTNGLNPQDKKFESINRAFLKLPASISEINEEIKVAQAKVFCLERNADNDAENTLHEFEKVQEDIDTLTEWTKSKTMEINSLGNKIETLRDKWLPELTSLIERINGNFSSFFLAMKCAGEIALVHGENP